MSKAALSPPHPVSNVGPGEIFVIIRRMDALKEVINQTVEVPDAKMAVLQFHYDQVHRALTKAFDLRHPQEIEPN